MMEKMRMESLDMVTQNIEKIGVLFPNCVTETVDKNGKQKKAINFDLLRQMLIGSVIEGDEVYEFTWVGKNASVVEAHKPIRKTLRPCVEESRNWNTTKNIYIEGDNLEVLKLLQESYLGKIKMIYIDPPYNTGSDFLYCDSFKMGRDEYADEVGIHDEEGNRLYKNSDVNGRFHSDWCSMMYSRLLLSRSLLTADGAIFISIDDNEVANLIEMCNELYGRKNFVGLFCRKTKAGGGSASGSCAVEHDYVLCYAKDNNTMSPLIERFDEKYLMRYKEKDEIGPYFWDTMERSSTATVPYLIEAPDGTMLKGKWFRSERTFLRDKETGEVRFLKKQDGKWSVQFKQRLADGKKLRTILESNELTDKRYRSLSEELESIVGCSLGHPPKPLSLMQTLVSSICSNVDEEDIILDFFSGSATTAHAVMQQNVSDGGKRRFIMVQIPEKCSEDSEAYRAGFGTVCEIGKERIRRAGNTLLQEQAHLANAFRAGALESQEAFAEFTTSKAASKAQEEIKRQIDTGFRVFKVADSNMKDIYYAADDIDQDMLSSLESNIKEDRTALDLFFGCLLEWGLPLSLPYTFEVIDGCTVHTYNDGDLIACFDNNIPEGVVKTIAKRKPLRAVFRDSGFANSPAKINVFEIFKLYMPESANEITKRVKVI